MREAKNRLQARQEVDLFLQRVRKPLHSFLREVKCRSRCEREKIREKGNASRVYHVNRMKRGPTERSNHSVKDHRGERGRIRQMRP